MKTLSGELRAHKARLHLTNAEVAARIGRSVSTWQRWTDPTSIAYHEGRHHAYERLSVPDLELMAQFLEVSVSAAFKLWKAEMTAYYAEHPQERTTHETP